MLSYYISQLRSILYVAPVMLLAIIVHECAHGWVSDKLGDPTPRMSGRLTLNPHGLGQSGSDQPLLL